MIQAAREGGGNEIMNAAITEHEVNSTFGSGSATPGPDGLSSKLIDEANRDLMRCCLSILWNRAWDAGYFITEWKQENRVVIPMPGKEDYHECSSYRTISITSCLGKRFEYITSKRLMAVLDSVNFDVNQFAYMKNRSSTQALLTLVEEVKKGLINGKQAGAVFFDFTDAFGSVNRNRLLFKIGNNFGISGKLFCMFRVFCQIGLPGSRCLVALVNGLSLSLEHLQVLVWVHCCL